MQKNLINILNSKQINKDDDLEVKVQDFKNYFSEFFSKFTLKNIYKLADISDKDILTAAFIVCNPMNTKEVLDLINKYPILLDEEYITLISIFSLYYNDEYFKEDIDNCLSFNKRQRDKKINKLFSKYELPRFIKSSFIEFLNKYPNTFDDLGVIFKNFKFELNNICVCFLRAKDEFNCIIKSVKGRELVDSLPSEMKKIFKKEFLPQIEESNNLIETANKYLDFLNTNYNKFTKECEVKEKERRRFNKNINLLINMLDTTNEIKDIDNILKLCPDAKSVSLVVDYIISHNKEIYLDLASKYDKARVNNDENLSLLFNRYGFSYDILNNIDRDNIKNMVYEDIESLLIRLKVLNLNNVNISHVSVDKLKSVEDLINKNFITKSWLKSNIDLISKKDNVLDLVISNINLLCDLGVNLTMYSNSLDILKSNMIKYNLDVLKSYDLVINKNTTNIDFLSSNDLMNRIDFVISIGLFQTIDNLDILNYSPLECYKLKIASILNVSMDFVDISEKELFDYSEHIIPDYLQSKLNSKDGLICELPVLLENYRLDNVTLNINGVLVSSEKVKRNLAKLGRNDKEACFYAIIYNGFYSYEEINIIRAYLLENESFYSLVKHV